MLCGGTRRTDLTLVYGLLMPDGLESLGTAYEESSVNATNSSSSLTKIHPPWLGGRADRNGKDGVEGASLWLDASDCLSLRASNWGTGDSPIFVVRQDWLRPIEHIGANAIYG
ncbi:hypothetical protein F4801DRAFT_567635 [Xylaria longipes]|nr:hypothetical protein F4801DRAFT_567635 [Xylaria longipes]